jgi:hypothetical protein
VGWGWALEVGTHAIPVIASGVFDDDPQPQDRIGHMANASVPAAALDNRYTRDRWPKRTWSRASNSRTIVW